MERTKQSLNLITLESVITYVLICMPIMVPFYRSIGMDQGQIGLSQAVFTAVVLVLNVPGGWLADRFSRKMANVVGDFGAMLALLFYATAHNFAGVVMAEVMFGLAVSFSNGVDSSMIKSYSDKLDSTGQLFRSRMVKMATWQFIAQVVGLAIGGLIGSFNFRLVIALSALPYLIGAVLSLFLADDGHRLVQKHKNPLKDMWHKARTNLQDNPYLRWWIAAQIIGTQITRVIVWAFTPLMLVAGVPLAVVAAGWIIYTLTSVAGAKLAGLMAQKLKDWQKFALPMLLVITSMLVMGVHLSLLTIWLYGVVGLVYGWMKATLSPIMQHHIKDDNTQTTMLSVVGSLGQLVYIPAVWLVNLAGNVDIRLTLITSIVLLAPPAVLTMFKLRSLEK